MAALSCCGRVGFRFAPLDEELVGYYLRKRADKGSAIAEASGVILECDVYSRAPWDLPRRATDEPMYYFTPRHGVSTGGRRVNRSAGNGFWHGNSKSVPITSTGDDLGIIGSKTSLVYTLNDDHDDGSTGSSKKKSIRSQKKGKKTEWIMHEYVLHSPQSEFQGMALCRIYLKKSGSERQELPGYGAAADLDPPMEMEPSVLKRRRINGPTAAAAADSDHGVLGGDLMTTTSSSFSVEPSACVVPQLSTADHHSPIADEYWDCIDLSDVLSPNEGDRLIGSSSTVDDYHSMPCLTDQAVTHHEQVIISEAIGRMPTSCSMFVRTDQAPQYPPMQLSPTEGDRLIGSSSTTVDDWCSMPCLTDHAVTHHHEQVISTERIDTMPNSCCMVAGTDQAATDQTMTDEALMLGQALSPSTSDGFLDWGDVDLVKHLIELPPADFSPVLPPSS